MPDLETSEKQKYQNKIDALIKYREEFQEIELEKQRHETEIIIGTAGFLTILSFTIHEIFLTGNLLFLWRLLSYNHKNKEKLVDNQIKSFVMATIISSLPFIASNYGIPKIIGVTEYVKTMVIG